jgi:hypothetical protein
MTEGVPDTFTTIVVAHAALKRAGDPRMSPTSRRGWPLTRRVPSTAKHSGRRPIDIAGSR